MHAVIMTRGMKMFVDNFFNLLQGQYLPWEVKSDGDGKNGMHNLKKGTGSLQLIVKPIQLWDIVFPREHRDLMLNTLLTNKGKPMNSNIQQYMWGFRKSMKLNKIPDYDTSKALPVTSARAHTEFIGIGVKDDHDFPDGTEAL